MRIYDSIIFANVSSLAGRTQFPKIIFYMDVSLYGGILAIDFTLVNEEPTRNISNCR